MLYGLTCFFHCIGIVSISLSGAVTPNPKRETYVWEIWGKKTIPSVSYWDNPCYVMSNVLEDGLRQVKVLLGRAAPPSRWAEISGGDHNGPWEAPLWIIDAPYLITRSTAQPIVKEGSAQSCCVGPIPLTVEITVSTSPTYTRARIYVHIMLSKRSYVL